MSLRVRVLCALIVFSFLWSTVIPPRVSYAQQPIFNPAPGAIVGPSPAFNPAMIKGITVHPDSPFQFDFIVHPGDGDLSGQSLRDESTKLIKYFMAALTVPEDQMWVNLSPDEPDRISPEGFGQTEMGRDLLAQDYLLKQLTASLMSPESELGQKFWDQIHAKAYERYGVSDVPTDLFSRVWIVPEKAVIYENGTSVFVVESHLKVMLEEDYVDARDSDTVTRKLSLGPRATGHARLPARQESPLASQIIRDLIIPEIEREVNEGKAFSSLRQIANSVILATWYKQTVRGSILENLYIDKNKTNGVDTQDKQVSRRIYDQYIKAFQKGVYDFIQEDYDPLTQQIIPRKYFSGGANLKTALKRSTDAAQLGKALEASSQVTTRFGDLSPELTVERGNQDQSIDNTKISLSSKVKEADLVVGYVGRIARKKGIEELIYIAQKVNEELKRYGKTVKFKVYGEKNHLGERLEKELSAMGLEGVVEFMGRYQPSDLVDILDKDLIDIGILPSRREGLPYTLLEYRLAGIPIVASNVGGVEDFITDGENGIVIDVGPFFDPISFESKVDSFSNAIINLFWNDRERKRMAEVTDDPLYKVANATDAPQRFVNEVLDLIPPSKRTKRVLVTSDYFFPYLTLGGAVSFMFSAFEYLEDRSLEDDKENISIALVSGKWNSGDELPAKITDSTIISPEDTIEVPLYPTSTDKKIPSTETFENDLATQLKAFAKLIASVDVTKTGPNFKKEEFKMQADEAIKILIHMWRFFQIYDYDQTVEIYKNQIRAIFSEFMTELDDRELDAVLFKSSVDGPGEDNSIMYNLKRLSAPIPDADVSVGIIGVGIYSSLLNAIGKLEKGIPYVLREFEFDIRSKFREVFHDPETRYAHDVYTDHVKYYLLRFATLMVGVDYIFADKIIPETEHTKGLESSWFPISRDKIIPIPNSLSSDNTLLQLHQKSAGSAEIVEMATTFNDSSQVSIRLADRAQLTTTQVKDETDSIGTLDEVELSEEANDISTDLDYFLEGAKIRKIDHRLNLVEKEDGLFVSKEINALRIIFELINNALDEQDEGIIDISLSKVKEKIVFSVSNKGLINYKRLRRLARKAAREKRLIRMGAYPGHIAILERPRENSRRLVTAQEVKDMDDDQLPFIEFLTRGKKARRTLGEATGKGLSEVLENTIPFGGEVNIESMDGQTKVSVILDVYDYSSEQRESDDNLQEGVAVSKELELIEIFRREAKQASAGKFLVMYGKKPGMKANKYSKREWQDSIQRANDNGQEIIYLRDYTQLRPRPWFTEHDSEEAQLWKHTHGAIRGLEAIDLRGKTVLDLGTGDGILAIIAAKLGARVIAVDQYDMSELISQNARANGVADRITFVQQNFNSLMYEKKFDMTILEDVDVVVMNVKSGTRNQFLEKVLKRARYLDIRLEAMILAGGWDSDFYRNDDFMSKTNQRTFQRLNLRPTKRIIVGKDGSYSEVTFVLEKDKVVEDPSDEALGTDKKKKEPSQIPGNLLSVGVSIGGTKIGVGLINESGEIVNKTQPMKWQEEVGKDATSEQMVEAIMRKVEEAMANIDDPARVVKIGIGFAGPVDSKRGIVGTPFPSKNLPFDNYDLAGEIQNRFETPVNVQVYNDGIAAGLGEFNETSEHGLDGMSFILGTGVNGSAVMGGKTFTDSDALLELGWNLIRRARDGQWIFTGYQARGDIGQKESEEDQYMEPLFSGAAITEAFLKTEGSKRVVEKYAAHLPEALLNVDLDVITSETPLTVDVEALLNIVQGEKEFELFKELKAITIFTLLTMIKRAIEEDGDEMVKQFVRDTGYEIGRAFAALVQHYHQDKWVEHIVLVSGVGESFAKVETEEDGGDIFVQAIRTGLRESLSELVGTEGFEGLDKKRVELIADGVERSSMDWEREVLAAKLTSKEIVQAREERGDSAIASEDVGGIDFNPAHIQFDKKGVGTKIQFPPYSGQVPSGAGHGFVPVIINIAPVTNIPLLLGEVGEEEIQQLSYR